MTEFASFYLEVKSVLGGKELAVKAWNSLWLFHLLALACKAPCDPLYSWSGFEKLNFSVVTPHAAFRKPRQPVTATTPQLEWARCYLESFELLQADRTFTASLLCYTNSHHLFGFAPRIMLLWSGIERLFKVSSELTRTLALYSALLLEESSADARYDCYKRIKKDYSLRSRVVHGSMEEESQLEAIYVRASELLVGLLARCVALSRVPTDEEFDRAATMGHIGPKQCATNASQQ